MVSSSVTNTAMLTIIRKHGQVCAKCSKALPIGSVATWSRDRENKGWICVEGVNACSPRDPEVIAAKKSGKSLDSFSFQQQMTGASTYSETEHHDEGELRDDMVFPPPPTQTEIKQQQTDAIAILAGALVPHLDSKLNSKIDRSEVEAIIDDKVADIVEAGINAAIAAIRPVIRLEVVQIDGSVTKVDGAHPKLAEAVELLRVANAVYIWGPPGGGKTHAAAQIATALNCQFFPFQAGKLSTESLIKAFVDAHGNIQDSEFADAYAADNTVLFLDEFDRWPVHLQVLLNTALANGYLKVRGRGTVRRGANFILGAGNTNMRGKSEYFPEAVAAEFSTLDRFAVIHWPYDEAHEENIALGIWPNAKPWIEWIRRIRPEALKGQRGKILATPRAIYDGARALRYTTLNVQTIAEAFVFKGIDEASRDYFLRTYPLPNIPPSSRDAYAPKEHAA